MKKKTNNIHLDFRIVGRYHFSLTILITIKRKFENQFPRENAKPTENL